MGTRLQSVVADRPKVLAEVRGRPFLAYLLDQLAGAGLRRAVLCVSYRAEQIRQAFGESYAGLRLNYSYEVSPQGTGGAIRDAWPKADSDPAIVLNGDSYCETDITALWNWHHQHHAQATMLMRWVDDPQRYGRVEVDQEANIRAFQEKCDQSPPGWINAGVYVLSGAVVRAIPAGRPVSIEREVFPAWTGRGLLGCPGRGRFLDIGTPASYAEAQRFFGEKAA